MSTTFKEKLIENNISLKRNKLETLQVNIGKKCNQACKHCHVDAGPNRTENMNSKVIEHILVLLKKKNFIKTIDITGGAPELNNNFKRFVSSLRKMNKNVIDRCNLTILHEHGQEDTAFFLASHQVQIIASLPCYIENNVDQQRGKGVFKKSISSIKLLNSLGYGYKDSNLTLNLVYNPINYALPPDQKELEKDYKKYLKENYKIEFNNLYTITNMPISRFAHSLKRDNKMQEYMDLLINNFNPAAASNVMCKSLISIGWDGKLYDCDFNQMLNIAKSGRKKNILSYSSLENLEKEITFMDHCYGCTAGAGSSCNGSTS